MLVPDGFAGRLQAALEGSGVGGVRGVARAAGVSHTTIYNWLGGKAPRSQAEVERVAGTLGLAFEELWFGTKPGEAPRPVSPVLERVARQLRAMLAEVEAELTAAAPQPTTPGRFPKSRTKLLPDRRGQQPAGDHDTNRNGDGGESAAGGS